MQCLYIILTKAANEAKLWMLHQVCPRLERYSSVADLAPLLEIGFTCTRAQLSLVPHVACVLRDPNILHLTQGLCHWQHSCLPSQQLTEAQRRVPEL